MKLFTILRRSLLLFAAPIEFGFALRGKNLGWCDKLSDRIEFDLRGKFFQTREEARRAAGLS